MRLFALTALTMVAFAANSILNRMGIVQAGMDPVVFSALRLLAGAAVLLVLARMRGPFLFAQYAKPVPVLSLAAYIFGFSLAYVSLDAGAGALILFGMVQITMFAGALLAGDRLPVMRWAGAAVAFGGLVWVLWPGQAGALPLLPSGFMAIAGIAWGIYSLVGRTAGDPLVATALNFALAVPIGALAVLAAVSEVSLTASGILLAMVSGAITSGLGYALWYAILPALGATRAAVAQLTVPVIAIAGGALMLGEVPGISFLIGALVVLTGVALSAFAK